MLMREYALEVKVKNNWLLQRMRLVGVETAAELSRLSGVSQGSIGDLLSLMESRQGDPQLAIERKERDRLLAEALDSLSEIERDIIRRRWGIETGSPETLEAVAKACGRTRERVRQIEYKGMRKLAHPSRLGKYKDDLIGGRSDAADQEGHQDQACYERGIRPQEGRARILCQRQQGHYQGRGQKA
jgi:RNA polymerase primary sigma factor